MQTDKNKDKIQDIALMKSLGHTRCGLGVSMGVGKTRIGIHHIIKNYDPFGRYLVVVPKNTVIESWKNEIDIMDIEVDLLSQMNFVNYRSIHKLNPNDYDIVYLDECHNLLFSHEQFLGNYNGKILGLTGTPPTSKGSEKYSMVQKYCPIIYKFSTDEAADKKILNDYKIIIHKLKLSQILNYKKKSKTGGFWNTSEVKDYDYANRRYNEAVTTKQRQFSAIMRMRALMEYRTKEEYVKGIITNVKDKCIIFANTQKQADRICNYSYHSKNPNSEENLTLFKDGRIDKLSCVLQLSEGISIPNLRQGIIMHSYGNERKTAQRIGRLLRLSPDQVAICHILCYENTVDEKWVSNSLKEFDQKKIEYFNPLN